MKVALTTMFLYVKITFLFIYDLQVGPFEMRTEHNSQITVVKLDYSVSKQKKENHVCITASSTALILNIISNCKTLKVKSK